MKSLSAPHKEHPLDRDGSRPVLLVDDDDDAILLIQLLLKRSDVSSPVRIATNGEQVVEYFENVLAGRAPLPQIVFLDLKLPGLSGFEVLSWIRARPGLAAVPVLIMSSSNHPHDLELARRLGADFYCEKYPAHEQLAALFDGKTEFPVAPALDFG